MVSNALADHAGVFFWKRSIMAKKHAVPAYIGLMLATLIWGYAFVVVKNALDSVPPLYMLAIRFGLATIGLCILFFPRLKKVRRSTLKSGFWIGFVLFLAYGIQTFGLQYTTAGKNAFLTTTYVIFVPLLNWLFCGVRPHSRALAAAGLAILGSGFLTLNTDLTINPGDLLSLLCGLGYAIHIVMVSRITSSEDPILLTTTQLGFAAVFSLIFAPLVHGPFPLSSFHMDALWGMLYLGFMSTMLALLLQNIGQKYTEPSSAALILSLESVFGLMFSMIFLQETVSPLMAIGCVLIFLAILISETNLFSFSRKTKQQIRV